MKIIGGNDYYDKGMMYGVDETVLLIRNNKVLEKFNYFPPMLPINNPTYRYNKPSFTYVFVVIGDKLYSGVEYDPNDYLKDGDIVWSYESYLKLMDGLGLELPKFHGYMYGVEEVKAKDYFEVKSADKWVVDMMVDQGYSILTGKKEMGYSARWGWIANPDNLKSLAFYKAVDAFTLYQTLDMWVSGVLSGRGAKTVEIKDNRVKIEKHGFDFKASFRKRK